jgi:antitoxin component YwqK of YwqJK toxin-antitoxin module
MVQKELLRNNSCFFAILFCTVLMYSCNYFQEQHNTLDTKKISIADTSLILSDTVLISDSNLSSVNNIYLYGSKIFSGVVNEFYANGIMKKQITIYQGMLHGTYRSFYEDGKPWEIRNYKNNLSNGKHVGYWPESGNQKFEYNYDEEKMQGLQKKWYKSGKPYLFLNYSNDREDGLQQGWRENGKLYLNYVAKDGYRYGLQKAALCYSLRDEKIINVTE